jgi:hypothetical protein
MFGRRFILSEAEGKTALTFLYERIRSEADAAGIPVVVAFIPNYFAVPVAAISGYLGEVFRAAKVQVADPTDALRALQATDPESIKVPNDGHLSANGHKALVDAVAPLLGQGARLASHPSINEPRGVRGGSSPSFIVGCGPSPAGAGPIAFPFSLASPVLSAHRRAAFVSSPLRAVEGRVRSSRHVLPLAAHTLGCTTPPYRAEHSPKKPAFVRHKRKKRVVHGFTSVGKQRSRNAQAKNTLFDSDSRNRRTRHRPRRPAGT